MRELCDNERKCWSQTLRDRYGTLGQVVSYTQRFYSPFDYSLENPITLLDFVYLLNTKGCTVVALR